MNKREKIVQGRFLDDEEAVLKELEKTYNQALKDIEKKSQKLYEEINSLQAFIDTEQDADEKARLLSMQQSKVYQKQYQDALKKQINGILDTMQAEEFQHISDYLKKCYEDGFIGTMYNFHGQGIPFIFPIDQEAVTRAVQIDSKISSSLYSLCGENVAELKKRIASEVSRGIATGASFHEIARQIRTNMIGDYNKAGGALYRSELIARTEGHRVQIQGTMDACYKAKDRGADVVKQWDSTLDGRTRESHQKVDGEVRELDENFSNGLRYPGDSDGGAAEVCNCRCALLQRRRRELNDGFSKMNNFTGELEDFESPEAYEDFKKAFFSKENVKYMNYVQDMEKKYKTKNFEKVLSKMSDREYKHYSKLLENSPMYKKKQPNATNGLTKSEKSAKISMQFFAESDIKNQESGSLKRAIRKYQKRIVEHEQKINNPNEYVKAWDSLSEQAQNGLKKHWQKEIKNFQTSIEDRVLELKERGDYDDE